MTQSNPFAPSTEPAADEIRHGRRAPTWTAVPEWVIVAGLSPQALALYVTVLAHVNRSREDGVAWPGMDALCALLGYKHRNSITAHLKELQAIGAIDVQRQPRSMNRRNIYVVHELPPASHAGPVTLAEFHKVRRREAPRHTEMCVGTHSQMGTATHTQMGQNQTNTTTRTQPDEDASSGDACAAGGQRTSSLTESSRAHARGKIKIVQPRNFNRLDDGQIAQALTAACLAAITKSGLVAADNAPAALGNSFKRWLGEGLTRQQLLARVRDKMPLVGTDDEGWGWLASEPVDASFDPWAA